MKNILTLSKIFAVALVHISIAACDKESEGNNGPDTGYATGKVTDASGKPISGARILLDNTVFYDSYIHGTTKEDGTYSIKVQEGAWRTFAYVDKLYNGKTYTMELFPDATDAFAEEGAERNFVWKLEGKMPWEAENYYGGTLTLSKDLDFSGELEDIELVLTPSGPLIDGSTGEALTLRYGDSKWKLDYEIMDIPIGRYIVTATLKNADGDTALKIQDRYTQENFVSEFQLDFTPKSALGPDNSASITIGD